MFSGIPSATGKPAKLNSAVKTPKHTKHTKPANGQGLEKNSFLVRREMSFWRREIAFTSVFLRDPQDMRAKPTAVLDQMTDAALGW
jgi:hypothetical protein